MHGTGSCKLVLDVENRPYDENERHGVQRCAGRVRRGLAKFETGVGTGEKCPSGLWTTRSWTMVCAT